MTNFSIRDAAQSDLAGGGARVPKAIWADRSTLAPQPIQLGCPIGRFARSGLAALLRVDGVRLAAKARARRGGGDGWLRARDRRGRGALGVDRYPARPR